MPERMTEERLEKIRADESMDCHDSELLAEIDALHADNVRLRDDMHDLTTVRDHWESKAAELEQQLAEARAIMDRLFREVRGNDDCEDDCIAESCPWMAASDWLGRQSAAQEKGGQ